MKEKISTKSYVLGGLVLIAGGIVCVVISESALIHHWNLQNDSIGDQQTLIGYRNLVGNLMTFIGVLWVLVALTQSTTFLRGSGTSILRSHIFKRSLFAVTTVGLTPCLLFFTFCILATFISNTH